MATTETVQAICIGNNDNGVFGLGDPDTFEVIHQPTKLTNNNIRHIYPSRQCYVYADEKIDHIWAAGSKDYGVSYELQPMQYFAQKSINIKKICSSVCTTVMFFITDENKVYILGFNEYYELGLGYKEKHVSEPILIPQLDNVIDAAAAEDCCIILCSTNDEEIMNVINNWSRLYRVSQDIISLLFLFIKSTTVYSTTKCPGSGQDPDKELPNEHGWNKIESLRNISIVKISAGLTHTMFLKDDGILYASGDTTYGKLGLGDIEDNFFQLPTEQGLIQVDHPVHNQWTIHCHFLLKIMYESYHMQLL